MAKFSNNNYQSNHQATSKAGFCSTENMNLIIRRNADLVISMAALFIISIIIIILVLSNFI